MELAQLIEEEKAAQDKADRANAALAEVRRLICLKLKDGESSGDAVMDYKQFCPGAHEQLLQRLVSLRYLLGRCEGENAILLHDLRTSYPVGLCRSEKHEFVPIIGQIKAPARLVFNAREPTDCFTLPLLYLNNSDQLENKYRFDPLKLGSAEKGIYFLNCTQHRERLVNDDLGNACKEKCTLFLIIGAARILDLCQSRTGHFLDWKHGSVERHALVRKQAFQLRQAIEQTDAPGSK